MTDLSQLSDADLMAALNGAQAQPDVGAMVTSEAQRQGVDPALAMSVARTESGLNPSAVSPKGAVGPMQLMPGTAAGLGVDPNDPAQNVRGGVTYLKRQLDRFQDPHLAVAAYNAGPGAVQKAGGVPNYPETQAYVGKVMGGAQASQMSDADLLSALGMAHPAAPVAAPPAPRAAPVTVQARPATPPVTAAPQPLPLGHQILSDAMSGLQAPSRKLAQDLGAMSAKSAARVKQPLPSLPQAAIQSVQDLGDTAGLVGDVAGLLSAGPQAVLNPIAGLISRYGPQAYSAPSLSMQGGKIAAQPGQPLAQPAAQSQILGDLNTALSAASPRAPVAAVAKPMTLDAVKAAKNAAYQAVDASGFTFPTGDVQKLAQDVASHVANKGGPSAAQLYPASKAMSERLTALAAQPGGVPLTQLDELRSDIYGALVKPGDREAPIGSWMRGKIDDLINNSSAPNIAQARDLNTRFAKMQAVTDNLDSADLRSGSTYSGGNYTNAVRQNMRRLVDPTSAQQIGNLTPAEQSAVRQVVTGTPGQNLTRYVTKILTNKIVQAPIAVMTHGAGPAVMEAVGSVLNKAGQAQTNGAIQKVLDLMSMGGKPPGPQPIPILQLAGRPPIPLTSTQGIFGLGALAQPTASAQARTR